MELSEHYSLLRKRAEARFGRAVLTSLDFKNLSRDILQRTGESLSASTLKRFWGYVPVRGALSRSSLDILSRYVGFASFTTFCSGDTSLYLDAETVSARALPPNALVQISWAPNRIVKLRHLDSHLFEVLSSEHSKLLPGDRFEVADFVVGFPLYLGRVFRSSEELPAYVAGATGGLTGCQVLVSKQ